MPYVRRDIKMWNFTNHPLHFGINSKKPTFTVEKDGTWYVHWVKNELLDYHFIGNTKIQVFRQIPVATDDLLLSAQRLIDIVQTDDNFFHMIYVSFPTAIALAKKAYLQDQIG